ncbi:glycoside hydrolase family 52 protein [Paenibacillus sp. FSL M7-0802]|jgi:hypothetical protein|uniref:glycoside hydrolase family 52 protein n=1 Tax=Paenibacillus sp. FSL M7-0802 TaxID=2921536 RepID=UPI0003D380CD|nr:glycoside hydrolase family 52 protein [Paenibacillus polymyxa]AHC22608.1 hypothetical protein X809_00800 [Paenibacillus polymyxa CR1]APB78079.1 hypothetical protein PPYC2_25525 [Paenibacillus polymyxa]OMF76885.1 hypothetical protein BK145_20325 [Paenibacillus peoriae]POR26924.1 hypothetical protein CG775_16025 [Paenibacillus polymyxa]
MNHNAFFNAHHSPIGAFASFTLGFPGANGGLDLELGQSPAKNIFIVMETEVPGKYEALPFSDIAKMKLSVMILNTPK